MPLTLAPQFTNRNYSWTNWKTVRASKNGIHQYEDDGQVYTIYFYDIPEVYVCTIWKDTVPDGIISGGYSQAQNDADKADFETNYLPTANKRISMTDSFGNPVFTDFVDAASFGLLPGVSVGTVNGYVPTSNTSTVGVRATTYIQPTTAAQRSVASSNVNDTSAGTGARTVKITYYDGSMNGPFTETVTLNGTTPVATVATNIRFVEKLEVITVGSNGANLGTISLFVNNNGSAGGTIGTIAISDNSTYWCHHYVPTGKTCYISGVRCGATVTNGSANIQMAGSPLIANLAFRNLSGSIRYGSANQVVSLYEWTAPLVIPGPNFIVVSARADANTASTTFASFDFYEF